MARRTSMLHQGAQGAGAERAGPAGGSPVTTYSLFLLWGRWNLILVALDGWLQSLRSLH